MAIAQVADLGAASNKVAGSSLSMSPASTVPVGAVVVLWSAFDNIGGGYGQITDSKGNRWMGFGFLAHGSVGAGFMAVCRVKTQIETTDTITHTWSHALNVAKAISCQQFSVDGAMRWCVIHDCAHLTNLAADPGAIAVTCPRSQEWLMLHLLQAEAPSTDAYTWDTDYTQITAAGTTGGLADSNMTVLGGYRIASLGSDTVDVTSDTANRDYNQTLTALEEVPYYSGFPTTPIIDTFNRADENPVDGGIWSTGSCVPANAQKLKIVSNVVAETGGAGVKGGQFVLATVVGPNSEVYATMTTRPTDNNGSLAVGMFYDCGNTSTLSGLCGDWTRITSGDLDSLILDRTGFNGGAASSEQFRVFLDTAAGNKLGVQARSAVAHWWVDVGSGWEWVAATESGIPIATAKLGLTLRGTVVRGDDFGGGDIPGANVHLLPLLHVGT